MTGVLRRLTFPIAATLLLAVAGSAWAEPLGRLFLTPERRAALDHQRRFNIREAQALEGDTVSLDGVVTRSSGRSTVWVNQRAQNEHAAGTGVTAVVSPKHPARAVLTPSDGSSASLRVGETINRGTHEKTDGLGGGRVTVNRRP